MHLKKYACSECLYETNSKEEFKKHAKVSHAFGLFDESQLVVKDQLQEVL